MKKLIIAAVLAAGIAISGLPAVETTLSLGGTAELSYWTDIKEFKKEAIRNSIDNKDYSFGPDVTFFSYTSGFTGLWGNAALIFPKNKLFNTWGILDFNLGPAFRIPLGNILVIQLGLGANAKFPIDFKEAMIGVGTTGSVQIGLGESAALVGGINVSYDFYEFVEKQKVTYLTIRPYVGIGFRIGDK